MPEARSRVVHKILEQTVEGAKSYTKERQLSAQAFCLHVEWRDGRRSEGFSWANYQGHRWTQEGEHEKLVVLFGERFIELQGHNLGALVEAIRDGQLNGIRELASGRVALLRQSNPENEPIVVSVKSCPEFDEILKGIGGENDDKGKFARRLER